MIIFFTPSVLVGLPKVVLPLGDDEQEVVGEHEVGALPIDAQLSLCVAQKVAKVDVEDAPVLGEHSF
jgi:hypothetical protein